MNQQIIGIMGQRREGHPIHYLKSLKQLLQKIDDVQKKQNIYEKFKNIKGQWSLPTYYSPYISGAGKPGTVARLIRSNVLDERNIVMGDIGNGMSYHSIPFKSIKRVSGTKNRF